MSNSVPNNPDDGSPYDFVEKISDNLYIHHVSDSTREENAIIQRKNDDLKSFIGNNGFHLKPNGRCGMIYYIENGKVSEIDCELSGSENSDIVIYFNESACWTIPAKVRFSDIEMVRIKAELILWLKSKKIRSNLD